MKCRVHARVSEEMGKRLRDHCLRRRKSIAAVVETALREHLDGTGDPNVLSRRFDRLDRAVDRAHRDVELQLEAFAAFVGIWFAHTPAVAEGSKVAAQQRGTAREREFIAYVARRYASGRAFREDPSDPSRTAAALVSSDRPEGCARRDPRGGG